jgi:hypothetical protein
MCPFASRKAAVLTDDLVNFARRQPTVIVLSDSVIVQYGQDDQQLITISARSHVIRENLLSMKLESEEIEDMGSALRSPGMVRGLKINWCSSVSRLENLGPFALICPGSETTVLRSFRFFSCGSVGRSSKLSALLRFVD